VKNGDDINTAPKKKRGRPKVPYNHDIGLEICSRLIEGEKIKDICRDKDMPAERTLWQPYARAREKQMERWADEIVEIADDSSGDYIQKERNGGQIEFVVDQENVQRSRLRIETRKWVMGKMAANRFADKVNVDIDAKVSVETMSDQELEDKTRARLLALGIDQSSRSRPLMAIRTTIIYHNINYATNRFNDFNDLADHLVKRVGQKASSSAAIVYWWAGG
jgi:hypothetical protein